MRDTEKKKTVLDFCIFVLIAGLAFKKEPDILSWLDRWAVEAIHNGRMFYGSFFLRRIRAPPVKALGWTLTGSRPPRLVTTLRLCAIHCRLKCFFFCSMQFWLPSALTRFRYVSFVRFVHILSFFHLAKVARTYGYVTDEKRSTINRRSIDEQQKKRERLISNIGVPFCHTTSGRERVTGNHLYGWPNGHRERFFCLSARREDLQRCDFVIFCGVVVWQSNKLFL